MGARQPRSTTDRVTAADVARASGVSTATVSYVLNNNPGQTISAVTRKRVLEAASRLGYVQNPAAQTLARGYSRMVLVDFCAIPAGELKSNTVHALALSLGEADYTPVVSWWEPEDQQENLLALARAMPLAAVITALPLPTELQTQLTSAGVGVVRSSFSSEGAFTRMVTAVAYAQADYLGSRGHRNIAYGLPSDPQLAELGRQRLSAFTKAAAKWSANVVSVEIGDDPDAITQVALSLREATPAVTALAAYNDEIAMKALFGLHLAKIRVPADIAVIGVDDLHFSAFTVPSLTTVRYCVPPVDGSVIVRSPNAADVANVVDDVIVGADDFTNVEVVERAST